MVSVLRLLIAFIVLAVFAGNTATAQTSFNDSSQSSGLSRQGRVTLPIGSEGRKLGIILDMLSRVSNYSIQPIDREDDPRGLIRDIMIRDLSLISVHWRDALNVIAEKYMLDVDDSSSRGRLLRLKWPKQVEITFPEQTDIKIIVAQIAKIAKQDGISIVVPETITGSITASYTNTSWREALKSAASAVKAVVVTERNIIRLARPEDLATQKETRVFELSYLAASGSGYIPIIEAKGVIAPATDKQEKGLSLGQVLEKVKSETGSVAHLQGSNSLIVTDTPQKLDEIASIITQLDRAPKQVHLSLKLIELSEADAEKIGLQWQNGLTAEVSGMSYSTMFPFSAGSSTDALAGTFPGDTGVLTPKDGVPTSLGNTTGWVAEESLGGHTLGTMSFSRLTALLQFIRTQTRGRVIQSPQLIALDHEPATIHVGQLVRYAESFSESNSSGGIASGYKEAKGSPVQLGIQVLVIPHVTGPDNNVILTVIPKTESAYGAQLFETFEGGSLGQLKLPRTVQRTVVTKMILRNRETGIIAGLREQSTGETITKIPLLGDLPLIGWLFRHKSRPIETNTNSTLLILVTPTVMDIEQKTDIGDWQKRAEEALGEGFEVDKKGGEVITPMTPTPNFMQ